MNATDVKGVVLAAIHGTGQGAVDTQAQVDQFAADYAAGKPLDVIIAGIVNTPAGLAYKKSVAALIASGGVAVPPGTPFAISLIGKTT
jgi:hypothetical protein